MQIDDRMQEKLKLYDDCIAADSAEVKKALADFSKKENQSLAALRSQFEFLDDGTYILGDDQYIIKNIEFLEIYVFLNSTTRFN